MTDSGRREANRLWSLILAAGGSSRLGTPKQLLRRGAPPLVSRAVTAAAAVTPGRVLVVLGAHALKLRLLLRRRHAGVRTVTNPGWSAGMAGSKVRSIFHWAAMDCSLAKTSVAKPAR